MIKVKFKTEILLLNLIMELKDQPVIYENEKTCFLPQTSSQESPASARLQKKKSKNPFKVFTLHSYDTVATGSKLCISIAFLKLK